MLHSDYSEAQLKSLDVRYESKTPGCHESTHDRYRHLRTDL